MQVTKLTKYFQIPIKIFTSRYEETMVKNFNGFIERKENIRTIYSL